MIQRFLTYITVALVVVLFAPSVAAAQEARGPSISVAGGGWGHGVGMSQYGALGRALDGATYSDILGFYYDGAQLADVTTLGQGGLDDVDVLVGVRSSVTLAPPNGAAGWQIELTIDGTPIGTATGPVTTSFDGQVWHATVTDDGVTTDFCPEGCAGAVLATSLTGPGRVVVEDYDDGPRIGEYAHGAIELVPAGATTPAGTASRCGNAAIHEFCVVNAAMGLDEYLLGVDEIPSSWPSAALLAQTVAARSYAVARMSGRAGWGEPFDLYATTSDQYFTGWHMESRCGPGGWCDAVVGTSRQVLIHDGAVITAVYSSSNGGHTATNADVWGSSPLPYLKAKPDPFDAVEANPNSSWERIYSVADVSRWLAEYPSADLGVGDVQQILMSDVPPSGYTDFALVTIVGSDATIETGGYRFWYALRLGCMRDPGCSTMPGRRYHFTSFVDVPAGAFYAIPVQWMVEHEITSGIYPGIFGPGLANTRAGLATFLWRFAGRPPHVPNVDFIDLETNAFYEQAVGWTTAEGITYGVLDWLFVPSGVVTRAQAAAMLWRFAGEPTPSVPNPFDDVKANAYYTTAVRWMVEWGITAGTTETTFSPGATLTRSEIAAFLWRLAGEPDAFADGVTLPGAMRVA